MAAIRTPAVLASHEMDVARLAEFLRQHPTPGAVPALLFWLENRTTPPVNSGTGDILRACVEMSGSRGKAAQILKEYDAVVGEQGEGFYRTPKPAVTEQRRQIIRRFGKLIGER